MYEFLNNNNARLNKGASISVRLTVSILLTVFMVSTISICFSYLKATKKAGEEIQEIRDRTTSSLADILEMPLWTYDEETIEDVGNLYASNATIVKLIIKDSLGKELFTMEKVDGTNNITKKIKVLHNGMTAGSLEVGISSNEYREANKRLLKSGIITTCINLSVLMIITGFLLRFFLKRPVSLLTQIVNSYVTGNYKLTDKDMPYIEFKPAVNVITAMGRQINFQIQELKHAEKKYRGIFENAVEGIFQSDYSKKFINANPSMAKILGYNSVDDLLLSVKDIGRECFFSHRAFLELLSELENEKSVSGKEIKGKKKNGEAVWLTVNIRLVENYDSSFFEGSIVNISDQKEKEIAQREQKAAEIANKAKTLFIARMSHEIRTPLNSILGMGELLMETPLTKEQSECIELLNNSGEFLLSIINDILDFSKIEAGQLELEQASFCPCDIIENVAELVSVRAEQKGLEVNCHFDIKIHDFLVGDTVRLQQIILNLASNAVKFTEKGRVDIEASLVENESDEKQDTIFFKVADTGKGIPKAKQSLIFEKFSQADSSIHREAGGTGLGLAISKQLVLLMGSELKVESAEEQGSVFYFTATFDRADEIPQKSLVVNKTLFEGYRFLVISENESDAKCVSGLISKWGGFVDSFSSVYDLDEKLNLCMNSKDSFDLLIISELMVEKLKGKEEKFPDIVVLKSGTSYSAKLLTGFSNIKGYINKPFKRRNILSEIAKCIGVIFSNTEKIKNIDFKQELNIPPVKILLADDIKPNITVIHKFLKNYPVIIDDCEDGGQALDKFISEKYDIILLDVEMPVLNGVDLTKKIRELEKEKGLSATPVIIVSAHAFGDQLNECYDAGCDEILIKPVRKNKLLATILKFTSGIEYPENENFEIKKTDMAEKKGNIIEIDEIFEDLLPDFFDYFSESLKEMKKMVENEDFEQLYRLGHGLKGSSRNYGFHYLGEIFLDIENAAKENNLAGVCSGLKNASEFLENIEVKFIRA